MVDVQALRTILTSILVPLQSLSFVFFLLMAVLGGLRGWVVLRAIGHPAQLGALISMFWIGSALNQIMPSARGDTIRVWLSVRRGYQLRSTVNSIVLGLRVDATTYLACIPLVVAVTVIPISIAGWGLREGLLVSLLSHAGIRPDAALAFSLMFGLLSAASCLPCVALWCLRSERVTAVLS